MENLEGVLVGSWDAIGCVLLLMVNQELRAAMASRQLPLLSNFFQRVQARGEWRVGAVRLGGGAIECFSEVSGRAIRVSVFLSPGQCRFRS
eukprot:6207346-Pleurochrysis_carterae.AAC.1